MRRLMMLFAAIAAVSAAPAAALIIDSGTVTPDASGYGYQPHGPLVSVPGTYRLTFRLDRAVDYLYLTHQTSEHYNEYCDPDGSGTIVYCGGDDVPSLPFATGANVRAASLIFTLGAPYKTPRSDGGYATTDFTDDGGYFEFETGNGAPIGYTLSLAAVPEPANWALLILGFGATGITLRARARGARPRPA